MTKLSPKKRPTVHDVAAAAGVSKSLVSLVLHDSPKVSDTSRARVLAAIETLDYRPNELARSLASRHSNLVGLVVDSRARRPWSRVIEGSRQAAIDLGYTPVITLCDGAISEDAAIDTFLGLRVDGLVLIGCEPAHERLATRVPLGTVGTAPSPHADSVTIEESAGARLAVDHLVSLGHRRIVHLSGGTGSVAAARMEGFMAAMKSHRLKGRVFPGGSDDQSGANAVRELMERSDPAPTAIIAATHAAAGALIAARESTRVPGDLSIIGFEDSDIARLHGVDMTVVQAPAEDMGARIVDLVLRRVDSGAHPQRISMQPTLIIRHTTAPAPG